ncbi:MAG TPA: hypothetical protein DIW46_07315, partial [Microbacterium sp.]|nr:hypothetical protein [Microbacterium sp.]
LGVLGIAWSPVSWGVAVLIFALVAWGVGRVIGRGAPRAPSFPGSTWSLLAALILGALLVIWRLAAYIGDPDAVSQTNDAVFHMNAVRYIVESADASSLHVSSLVGGSGFYPAAWHALVSLIVQVTGTSIPIAANMLTLVIGAVIWPLGLAWLTRLVAGSAAAVVAAVLAGVMQNFPLLMFQWGVLFPNALSTALIPAAVGLVIFLPVWNRGVRRWQTAVRSVLVVAVSAGSLAVAQPAALLPWGGICVVWLSCRLLAAERSRDWRSWVALIIAWSVFALAWIGLSRSTSGSHWPFFRTRFEALLDIVLNSHVLIAPQIGISILMLLGLVVAVRTPRLRWFALAWLGVSGVYWLVAAVGNETVRNLVLGAWYADPYRIAALVPVVVIPLAAVGAEAVVRAVADRLPKRAAAVGRVSLAVLILLAAVLVLLRPVPLPSVTARNYDPVSRYESSDKSYLSDDERALLEQLDELVEPGVRVIGNPSTGVGFGYFFSGVDVYPRTWSPPADAAWQILAEDLRYAADDPDVCGALAAFDDPAYVLDFGPGETRAGRWLMPGITEFAGQDGFELVAEEGDASLWRITACDQ